MNLNLKGKTIVVGGGAGSIGTALCNVLREEEAKVVVLDLKEGFDLSDPKQVESFFENIPFLYGYCSLVWGGDGCGFLETKPEVLDKTIKNTLLAAVYPIQFAVRKMLERGEGHIVIASSVNTVLGLNEFPYDVAKGAVNRIAPDIATAHGKDGICAVTLCFGTVEETASWGSSGKALQKIAKAIPDRRLTTPTEISKVIAFLMSNHAWVFNGNTLLADRGWCLNRPEFSH